jgi:Flp pilus assembly protein TadD
MIRTVLFSLAVFTFLNACSSKRTDFLVTHKSAPAVQRVMQRQVRNALDAGDGDLAARRLRERVTAEPDNEQPRLELAAHYRKSGMPELAVEYLRVAAERFPRSERVLVELVEALQEQRETTEAISHLEAFLKRQTSASAAAWLGILRDQQGDWKSGESAHRAALAADPSNSRFRNNLGYNLLQQGKRSEAIAELKRAVAQDASLTAARNNLAFALATGSPRERREALEIWRSMADPGSAHNNLAAVLIEHGAYAEAREQLQAALAIRQDLPQALHNLKLVSELDGRPADVSSNRLASPSPVRESGVKAALKKVWFVVAGVEHKPAGNTQPAAGSE